MESTDGGNPSLAPGRKPYPYSYLAEAAAVYLTEIPVLSFSPFSLRLKSTYSLLSALFVFVVLLGGFAERTPYLDNVSAVKQRRKFHRRIFFFVYAAVQEDVREYPEA